MLPVLLLAIITGFVINCGNKGYDTVKIGNQVWMAENLNVDHYSNGDPIPEVQDLNEWRHLTTGAWCYYGNDPANGKKYRKLYNWYAVNDPRGLAPKGWHVPTNDEWQTLVDYLGGSEVAGGKMKEAGTRHWESPNTGASNESGFSALPGGHRYNYGNFSDVRHNAYFWSSSESMNIRAWLRILYSSRSKVSYGSYIKQDGFSIRCVRDN
jgi:uncharacterized protein (TIGR02145 family)